MKKVSFLVLIWFLSMTAFAQTSPNKYLIKYLETNTAQPDYGVTFLSDNQFVYKSPSSEKINLDSQKLSVSNLYIATVGEEGEILEKKQIQGIPVNKITKTGASYSKDLKTVYFSAMKYRKKRKRNDREQLYKADVDTEGNWSNMVKLPFSNSKYSFGEPALSVDGMELYFTSDMPSSIGGADIFVVDIKENGTFGKVRNLGSTINTSGNEVTAYISKNNMLYFSSDGHPNGLGNLDVYASDLNTSNIPTTPIHLDAPINSASDDFSFISNSDKRGYFASNRLQGQNNHDIYSFLIEDLIKDEKCVQEIVGVVKDEETEQAIEGASITLFDDENIELKQIETDTEGAYKFILDCNKTYTIKASGETYNTEEHIVNTANYLEAPKLEANKFLIKKTADEIVNTESVIANVDEVKSMVTEDVEEERNSIEETVSEEQVATVSSDVVDSSKTDKEELVDVVAETSVAIEEEKEVKEAIITKERVIEEVTDNSNNIEEDEATINPVYFGYDKFNITAKAAKELDKIANILNNNKNIHIEVSSYTDSRGTNAYNLKLSERRAKASADYLVALGISRSRITTKGYGESKMVNKCFDGIECSEAAHEKNRRTEFIFLNPQAGIEMPNQYESTPIKETEEIIEEESTVVESSVDEVFETIVEETNSTVVAKEESVVENKNPTYADTEESSDESFSELNKGQQTLTNIEEREAKPASVVESSIEDKVDEVTAKNNTNPSTKKVDGLTVSQKESSNITPNGLSEEEMEEVLSFQEDKSPKEKEVIKEPETQRNAFNVLIAEAEAERKQEENANTKKSNTKKIDNSVPNQLLAEIKSQVVQPTTKSVDKEESLSVEKQAKKTVRDEKSIYVSTTSIDAMQSKKGKYIETDKAKKIHALRVIFRIKENYLASRGAKDAFIVIRSPKGKVISEKGVFTLVNGKEQAYTDDTTVYFNSQSIKVVMFIDKIIHKFTKGTYTLDVYIEGHLVGSDTLSLS